MHIEPEQFDPDVRRRRAEYMVVEVVEDHIEHRAAGIGLHGLQRITSMPMARAFDFGNVFDGVEPCRMAVVEPYRNRVQEQSGGHFGAGPAGASVRDQSRRHVGLAGGSLQGQAVCGEQQRFHRQSTRRGKLPGGILQPLGNENRSNGLGFRRCLVGDKGFQRRRARPGQGATPEFLCGGTFERLQLQPGVLGKHARRMGLDFDGRHADFEAGQVVLYQLAYQVRNAPAVQDRVMKCEDQINTLVPDKGSKAVERSAVQVVALRASRGYVVLDVRIACLGHDVQGSRHPPPDNLHRHRMSRQFER